MQFPNASGTNLHGQTFNLPQDLTGQLNIVTLAFTQWQQPLVDTWVAPLEKLVQANPIIAFYEIPTVYPMNWLRRRWLDGIMRAGIPDDAVRARTITIYVDIEEFLAEIGLPNPHNIYTLVIDRSGHIYWGIAGEYRPEHGNAIQNAITEQRI
jgi:hypothetical protein